MHTSMVAEFFLRGGYVAEGRRIALFFTGRQHAGKNFADVLKRRADELPIPIHMSDALLRIDAHWVGSWELCREKATIVQTTLTTGTKTRSSIGPVVAT